MKVHTQQNHEPISDIVTQSDGRKQTDQPKRDSTGRSSYLDTQRSYHCPSLIMHVKNRIPSATANLLIADRKQAITQHSQRWSVIIQRKC